MSKSYKVAKKTINMGDKNTAMRRTSLLTVLPMRRRSLLLGIPHKVVAVRIREVLFLASTTCLRSNISIYSIRFFARML